jgi:hypothetical protein
MTDSHYIRRQRERTIAKLMDEVRPMPCLDPGTDRADDLSVWMMVAGTSSDVLGILALSDCELAPHLEDLRRIIEAIDRRISPLGG